MLGYDSVLGGFKYGGGGWKVILKSPKSGCGKSVVYSTRKRKMTICNSSLSDLNFKDPTIMKQSPAFIRNILVFIDQLHMQKRRHGFHHFTNPLTICVENRFHELAVVDGLDERTEGPSDEVQSTCAKGVTWIALDMARIGDEVVATKVEFVSEAISESSSENTDRTDITATVRTKNEHDEQI